jgi:AICAR transformylase/IMP cyclohydrolase PurH
MVDQWDDMIFGVKLSRHLRSDACVAVRDERLIAKATDLPSQSFVWSRLAESAEPLQGAALVFDSDIENADTLVEAKNLGIDAVVHPGIDGDAETHLLEQANELGLALISTGVSFRKR